MISTDYHVYMVNFHFSARKGEVIVQSTQSDLEDLADIILNKKQNKSFAGMDVYELDGFKFKKTTIKKFRERTNFCTHLDAVLSNIYDH